MFDNLFNKNKNGINDNVDRVDRIINIFNNKSKTVNKTSISNMNYGDVLLQISNLNNKKEPNNPLSKNNLIESLKDDVGEIFDNLSVPKERIDKYNQYDSMVKDLDLIRKIESIYISSICNTYYSTSASFLNYNTVETSSDNKEDNLFYKKFAKDVVDYFNIEKNLKKIVIPKLLRYGDYFIEIILLDNIDIDIEKSITDTKPSTIYENTKIDNNPEELLLDSILNFENLSMSKDQYQKIINKKENNNDIYKIVLKYHNPHNIIPLYSDYNDCIGYLAIDMSEMGLVSNITNTFSMNGIGNAGFSNMGISALNRFGNGSTSPNMKENISRFIKRITKKIIDKYKTDLSSNSNLKDKIEPEVFYLIKKLIMESEPEKYLFTGKNNKKINVRFIKSDNMVHFSINVADNFPLGTSIIEPLLNTGKMYYLFKVINSVSKMSRSVPQRKYTLEVGPRNNNQNEINQIKEHLRNTKVTANDMFGNSKEKPVATLISEFKDVMAITKNGQKFLDVETTTLGDPDLSVRDLEDIRTELLAISGIPQYMLGFADGDLRENLVQQNIFFSTNIASMQYDINDGITKIVNIICKYQYPEKQEFKKNMIIELTPPTSLTLSTLDSSMASVQNVVTVLSAFSQLSNNSIPVNPLHLLKTFIPYYNWDKYLEDSKDLELQNNIKGVSPAPVPGE